jgi:predicted Zn-dependent peptidase
VTSIEDGPRRTAWTRSAVLLATTACASAAPAPPARPTAPPPIDDVAVAPPRIDELHLASGIRVLLVENHRVPLVAITALHRAAGGRSDGGAGLAALTIAALGRGAGARSADDFAAALDRAGARLDLQIATDYAATRLVALADRLPAAVDVLADAIRRPLLDDGAIAQLRAARVAELARHRAEPRIVAAQLFDRAVFGDHPYAAPAEGLADRVAALTGDDVRAFWRRAYGPNATTFVVAGDVTRDVIARELERAFGDWRGDAMLPPRSTTFDDRIALAYVVAPEAAQTIVLAGRRVAPATLDADVAADVAGFALAGDDRARLAARAGGRITSAAASAWRGEWSATWTVVATAPAAQTAAALHELFAQLAAIRASSIDDAELAHARGELTRGIAQTFDTDASAARALERIVARGLPIDHYAAYVARLAALTPAAVRAAIAERWTNLSVVVVGDRAHVADVARELGDTVPIALYDGSGAPLAAP